jgi:hypothetical protein
MDVKPGIIRLIHENFERVMAFAFSQPLCESSLKTHL